jgi:hypothetical protein
MKLKQITIFLFLAVLFKTQLSEAQNNKLQWAHRLKVNKSNSNVWGLSVDNKKNVFITGYFSDSIDTDPGIGTAWLSASYNQDAFICKYDSNGQYLWSFQLGGQNNSDAGHEVAVDGSGNVYVCGKFNDSVDFDPGTGKFWMFSKGESMFVAKYKSDGKFVWAKQIGGSLQDWPGQTLIDKMIFKKNIYISGHFYNAPDFDPGPGVATLNNPRSNADGYVCALDTNGNFVLAKQFAGWGNALVTDVKVAVDNSGNIYATGNFTLDSMDFNPGVGTFRLKSRGDFDVFLVKLDATGNFNWVKQFGSSGYDGCMDVIVDPSDNIYFSGEYTGTVDFDASAGTATLTTSSGSYGFVCKYNANGTFSMAKKTGGGLLSLDAANNIYITGTLIGTVDFDPDAGSAIFNLTGTGSSDLFVCKLTSIGKFQWAVKTTGQFSSSVQPNGVFTDAGGNLYTAGNFTGIKDFNPGAAKYELNSNSYTATFFMKLGGCNLVAVASNVGTTLTATPAGATYQWFNCSTKLAIAGATNQQYVATASGNYGCWVTVGECKDTTDCIAINITTGTSGINKNRVQVYPNPGSGFVNITIPEKASMILHDLNGRIIKTYIIEAGANSLNLTDIKPGVYYATFAADSWQMTQKMVLNPE